MSRQTRFYLAGLPQHFIQRGNNGQTILLCARDYEKDLSDLGEVA